mgnify:CR=1 FL=1
MGLERINQLKKEKRLTNARLAELSGVNLSTLDKITGGFNTNPTLETLRALARALECTPGELLDEGPAAPRQEGVSDSERAHLKKYRVLDAYGRRSVDAVLEAEYDRMTHIVQREEKGWITHISCYDLAVSAGLGEPLGDTYYTQKLEIPTERVPENAHFCVRVNGSSMEPAYRDGDLVFVERAEAVQEGEIGIFTLNGEGYIKQLGAGALVSLNTAYKPIPLHDYDDLRCMGKVLGKV